MHYDYTHAFQLTSFCSAAPMDYVPVTDLELTFPANSVMGSTVSAEIVINNDIVLETNGEMFFVDITSSDADIEIGRERATIQLNETNDDSKGALVQLK